MLYRNKIICNIKHGNNYNHRCSKQFLKDALGWGFILWLIGYILGIALFAVVSPAMLGWIIMPIGIVITLWVLFKKVHPVKSSEYSEVAEGEFNGVKSESFQYYFFLAIVWTLIAVIFDYFFLVKLFKPADGYYKLDVYLYYALTFLLPLFAGWRKQVVRNK